MKATLLRPLVRPTPGQGPHLPAEVRRSFRERARRAICRECCERMVELEGALELAERLALESWQTASCCTRQWTAAVLFPHRVGLALEPVRHRRQEAVRKVTDSDELELLGGFRWQHFARLYSGKLALLRMAELPLEELPECRLVAVVGPRALVLQHGARLHHVHQLFRSGCYASVCAERGEEARLSWDWRETPAIGERP